MPVDFRPIETVLRPEFLNWGQQFLQLPKAWTSSRGSDVRVGIIDTGMAVNHPDLREAIVANRDFTGSPTGVSDDLGHGTHVAGIVAAKDDEQGVVGVAPQARLLNAKVLRHPGAQLEEGPISEAVQWCVAEGAGVICMSLTWSKPVPRIREAIEAANQAGVLVVAATGNRGGSGGPVGYPARYPDTLGVGYVNLGSDGRPRVTPDSAAGPEVDVVAPGGAILSTFPPNVYAVASGTSMATPFVAGVLALLLSHRRRQGKPPPTLAELRTSLRRTNHDLYTPGEDAYTGWGLVDPERLLSQVGSG